ncbi:hypothetical protein [Entomospira culicis]|uniref:C2H2-type domain-containing protein n=1 Tax=Entomospira culicis TaxID=2719989 RepID=A0A968L076_9SPIO|nr:hypothetical protein [Entomospira culicis]NIZ19842.1 hypothetical protein [Entomospira culicis]NIZ70056.1 hypothetical protein [Entomospira culicis]WDI37160.1 hypothetical protein PVA46_07525 [Entomospira culicis]WDI38789.1 hypothetical protein PVA47_07535 [Entomospira culicis]
MAENFYCECCGKKYSNVRDLTSNSCSKSPTKKHVLYEGSEKKQYTCKLCGKMYSNLVDLTSNSCSKSPTKKHVPAR